MRGGKRLALLAAATLLLAPLWGCGSNRDSDGITATTLQGQFGTDPASGVVRVGAGTCIGCHQDISFSADLVGKFLGSKHVVHEDHINAASPAECLVCHDPIGDGRTLEGLIDAAGVPAEGLVAVTCENCHGAGGQHFGVGPIPRATPDFNVCGNCHRDLPLQPDDPVDHLPVFGVNILANYQSSNHADSFSEKLTPGTQDMIAVCARCHTDEGFRELGHIDGGEQAVQDALNPLPPLLGVNVVQCRTCHDPHSGQLRAQATTATGSPLPVLSAPTAFSAQFNLCTNCHQAFLTATSTAADGISGPFTYQLSNPPDAEFHNPAGPFVNIEPGADPGDRTIIDTHFDNPDTPLVVEGYNINAADESACTICHDPHAAAKFPQAAAAQIAAAWGTSGHADYLGEPFTHVFTDNDCMKCHSGTEYAKFVSGVEQDELDLAGGPRVIACVACHDLAARDAAGNLALGAPRQVAEVVFPSGAVQNLGDGSNLCAECHQGRESGLSIVNAQPNTVVQAAVADYDSFDFINRHYYAEAANLFGAEVNGGFQYAGKTYQGRFPHFQSTVTFFTCTDCHMDGDAVVDLVPNHRFRPKAAYCNQCHPTVVNVDAQSPAPNDFQTIRMTAVDFDGDGLSLVAGVPAQTEGIYFEIWPNPAVLGDVGLIDRLEAAIMNYAATALQSPVVYDGAVYPYFFKDTNANGLVDAGENVFANRFRDFDRKLLQAAYNFQVVQKDPCGYIHNAKYLIQLIIDSIEDLGGSLNGSVAPFVRP